MRWLFDRGHLFERRMRQRIVLTAFDFHYIRTKALIEGGGGGWWSLSTFLSQMWRFFWGGASSGAGPIRVCMITKTTVSVKDQEWKT